MTDAAPFHAETALYPGTARAFWAVAADGVRLRLCHFPARDAARGTVLLFPGRTEHVEKYALIAATLNDAGWHALTIDWRGQGLSDRLLDDPMVGHVGRFRDYQHDVAVLRAAVDRLGLPTPLHLIAHSMGGCIGLRSVLDGLDVATVAFSAPMWGIRIAAPVRPAAWALSWSSRRVGLGAMFAPGTSPESVVVASPFEDNTLTTDPEMWDYMRAQLVAHPGLQLGGPSMHWLHEALRECRALARRPSPALPCLCVLGGRERIVDPVRIRDRMARWPGGRLEVIADKEHEVLMEDAPTRKRVTDAMLALFAGGKAQPVSASA